MAFRNILILILCFAMTGCGQEATLSEDHIKMLSMQCFAELTSAANSRYLGADSEDTFVFDQIVDIKQREQLAYESQYYFSKGRIRKGRYQISYNYYNVKVSFDAYDLLNANNSTEHVYRDIGYLHFSTRSEPITWGPVYRKKSLQSSDDDSIELPMSFKQRLLQRRMYSSSFGPDVVGPYDGWYINNCYMIDSAKP